MMEQQNILFKYGVDKDPLKCTVCFQWMSDAGRRVKADLTIY